MLKLPFGTDSDVHFSSPEAIATARKNNSPQYQRGHFATAEKYVAEEMEPLGIESAWMWINPHASLYSKELYERENRNIYKISQTYQTLHPFGWLTYFKDEETSLRKDRIKRFFEEYGFCGIKINIEDADYTENRDFRLTPDHIASELAYITQHYPNKIIAIHTGINVPDRKAHPALVGAIAKEYSDLTFVMVHTGSCPGPVVEEYHLDAMQIMQENPKVCGILSMINADSVLDVYKAVRDGSIRIEQVLVGSDYPFNTAIGTLESRYNLACHPSLGFTDEQVQMIMSKNAEALIQKCR